MDLISVVLILAVIGVLLWLLLTYVPMAAPFKQLITAVVVIAAVLWLLSLFIAPGAFHTIRVGR